MGMSIFYNSHKHRHHRIKCRIGTICPNGYRMTRGWRKLAAESELLRWEREQPSIIELVTVKFENVGHSIGG